MGGAGTAAALETAGIALMSDDLGRLPFAVGLSRRARSVIRQNLYLSLGVIAFLAVATVTGLVGIGVAVIVYVQTHLACVHLLAALADSAHPRVRENTAGIVGRLGVRLADEAASALIAFGTRSAPTLPEFRSLIRTPTRRVRDGTEPGVEARRREPSRAKSANIYRNGPPPAPRHPCRQLFCPAAHAVTGRRWMSHSHRRRPARHGRRRHQRVDDRDGRDGYAHDNKRHRWSLVRLGAVRPSDCAADVPVNGALHIRHARDDRIIRRVLLAGAAPARSACDRAAVRDHRARLPPSSSVVRTA